jgi:hypothetical protein
MERVKLCGVVRIVVFLCVLAYVIPGTMHLGTVKISPEDIFKFPISVCHNV